MSGVDENTTRRKAELAREAPISPRARYFREGDRVFLCGTIGANFDAWQRRLSVLSAADALFAQEIGLAAVERVMDDLEAEVRKTLMPGERLMPRRSPGYGALPLALSREILQKVDAPRRLGVSMTASDLLVPAKSVTAICEVVR